MKQVVTRANHFAFSANQFSVGINLKGLVADSSHNRAAHGRQRLHRLFHRLREANDLKHNVYPLCPA